QTRIPCHAPCYCKANFLHIRRFKMLPGVSPVFARAGSVLSGFSPMLANILILKKRRRTVPGKIDQHPRRASASDKNVRGTGKHFEERIIAAAPCPKPDISASSRRKPIDQDIQRPG